MILNSHLREGFQSSTPIEIHNHPVWVLLLHQRSQSCHPPTELIVLGGHRVEHTEVVPIVPPLLLLHVESKEKDSVAAESQSQVDGARPCTAVHRKNIPLAKASGLSPHHSQPRVIRPQIVIVHGHHDPSLVVVFSQAVLMHLPELRVAEEYNLNDICSQTECTVTTDGVTTPEEVPIE